MSPAGRTPVGERAVLTTPRPALRLVRAGEVSPAVGRARADRSMRRTLAALTIATAALTLIGLVMVLSASSVSAYAQQGSSFFFFKRQIASALVGLACFFVCARLPHGTWRRAWGPLAGTGLHHPAALRAGEVRGGGGLGGHPVEERAPGARSVAHGGSAPAGGRADGDPHHAAAGPGHDHGGDGHRLPVGVRGGRPP